MLSVREGDAKVALSPRAYTAQVGPHVAGQELAASALLELLERYAATAVTSGGEAEELVLNVVAALTNLFFYEAAADDLGLPNQLSQLWVRLPRHLTPLLLSANLEAVVEAARAFGNLSRVPEVRTGSRGLAQPERHVVVRPKAALRWLNHCFQTGWGCSGHYSC